MNFIVNKSRDIRFYTSMLDVERWLGISLASYDWHVSDVDGGWEELNDPSWLIGEEFKRQLQVYDHQFVWAVFSAFKKGTVPFVSELPYADLNPSFWQGEVAKQLPEAEFEVVCWDSSATLFIGLPGELGVNLQRNVSEAVELGVFNARLT